jgi:hypothetical protein
MMSLKMRRAILRGALAALFFTAQWKQMQVCAASSETLPVVVAPQRVQVQSTVIASVGYDETTRMLDIEFHSGAVWRYLDVPPEIHRALLDADSKGRFYNANIKGRFKARKILQAQ